MDARLRALERARAVGDPAAAQAWLRARMRRGALSLERVRLAARLGDPAARALLGTEAPEQAPQAPERWPSELVAALDAEALRWLLRADFDQLLTRLLDRAESAPLPEALWDAARALLRYLDAPSDEWALECAAAWDRAADLGSRAQERDPELAGLAHTAERLCRAAQTHRAGRLGGLRWRRYLWLGHEAVGERLVGWALADGGWLDGAVAELQAASEAKRGGRWSGWAEAVRGQLSGELASRVRARDLRARLERGELSEGRLLARCLAGETAARRALGWRAPRVPRSFGPWLRAVSAADPGACAGLAVALAESLLPSWSRTHPDDPRPALALQEARAIGAARAPADGDEAPRVGHVRELGAGAVAAAARAGGGARLAARAAAGALRVAAFPSWLGFVSVARVVELALGEEQVRAGVRHALQEPRRSVARAG